MKAIGWKIGLFGVLLGISGLLETGASWNLHDPAHRGDVEEVRRCIEEGADPNERDSYGRTPLHYAAYYGHVEVVRVLLDEGADPTAEDEYGKTPSDRAKEEGHFEVVCLLRDRAGTSPSCTRECLWCIEHPACDPPPECWECTRDR